MLWYAILVILAFIVYVKWRHSYWTRRGTVQMDPVFFFGNALNTLTGKSSLGQAILDRYNTLKTKSRTGGGIYVFLEPLYCPIDPQIIKRIVQTDFNHFRNHGLFHHHKDILTMNLFMLEDDAWKKLRAKLTPTFTSGKMKMMFETLVEKTDGLEKLVQNYADSHEPLAIKEALGRFTTDIIASCAFGLECNSLQDPNNLFRVYGKKVFEPKLFRFWMMGIFPWWLLGYAGFKSNGTDVSKFFIETVQETIRTREMNHILRKDFMYLLLELKNQQLGNQKKAYTLSDEEIIAQCFIFFLAGFETSSTTMTFALLELSQNPGIQEKLRQEINSVLEKYNGKITYDAVMEMKYLEKVINETLRKFPPVPAIPRICNKDYTIPGTNSVIQKGTRLNIPIWGIHKDPEYYPDPERFDPERFSEENKAMRPDFTFLPFGEGPRMCIGLRFGMLQSRVGLVSLIRNFYFSLNEKTAMPLKMSMGSLVLSVKGEVWLNALKITNK